MVSEDRAVNFPWNISIDSGYEKVVVAKSFAEKMEFRKEKTILGAELGGGTLIEMQQCTRDLFIPAGEAISTVRPCIGVWIAFHIILGISWLSKASPNID